MAYSLRKEHPIFHELRRVVYPDGKMAMAAKDYLQTTRQEIVLRHVAWKGGLAAALRFAGFKEQPVSEEDAAQSAGMLNAGILGEADFLTRTCGFGGLADFQPVVKEAIKTARQHNKQEPAPDSEHGPGYAAEIEAMKLAELKKIRDDQVRRAIEEGFAAADLRRPE